MTESTIVFRALCALLTTPQNTKLVKESLCVLESVISRSKEDTLEETTQSKDWEMCESEDRRHAATITGRSPFTAYFQQAMQEVKEQVAGEETWLVKEDNPYYCPGNITVLFDTYLAIFPLWSGLLLGDLSRKMHQSLQGRYTENIIQHKLPQKLLLQPETPVNLDQSQETWMKTNLPQKPLLQPEPPVNLDQSQETWMKTNQERFPSTKSKFYSVPQKIPVPKKRRLDVTQSKKSSSCHTSQLPAKVDMLWKKPPTELIVAILRFPRQKNESLLHHREFQSLRPHEWLNGELHI
ncbi:hypothetical protein G5714_004557 [Onychostoma macrolepis]|uniref:Uncharacterized protein n=1 Tax=Onychostoma macrolepis TaxID=369639 RepID=A0A7J6D5U5_9TELE|nr:hypothetical protein G5714_004557 [Onychostoma macrolepis]